MKSKVIISVILVCFILTAVVVLTSFVPVSDKSVAEQLLQKLGFEYDKIHIEAADVKIPEQFDSVYKNYNDMQKQAGYNLEEYKGKTVQRFTFSILNFDGAEDVYADVFVYRRKVIGGDIMTRSLNGFMVPLQKRDSITVR